MNHPLKSHLQKQLRGVKSRLAQAEQEYSQSANDLKNAENRVQGSGLVSNENARTLSRNMEQALSNPFAPGNVGDINRVIWPFWFSTSNVTVNPNQAINANFTVTQEAAFVWMSYSKVVYLETESSNFQYIDPDQAGGAGKANNLSFDVSDSQSGRSFFDKPMDINQVGYYKKPSYLDTPQLLLPNSNIAVNFQNNDPAAVYKPFLTFYGYRVRIEHAKDILGTVVG